MKKLLIVALVLSFSVLLSCGNNGKTANTNAGMQTAGQVSKDWKSWLVKYDKFMDEYIVIMKKIQDGDQTAALKAVDFASQGQTLAEEALELNKILSQQEQLEFEVAYKKIQKKLGDAGLVDQ